MKAKIQILLAVLAVGLPANNLFAAIAYPIVATGQTKCYDNSLEISPPKPGQPFYGQDAQIHIHLASYTVSADGLTVRDNVTGLTWQRSPDTDGNGNITASDKRSLTQAKAIPAKLNATKFGGFDDWRLPTIKEQYSLFDGRGTDPSPTGNGTSDLTPFIDTKYFHFAYGDTSAGERIIDSQYISASIYVGSSQRETLIFGVNFADGRIKGYGSKLRGRDKTFFVQCVRGNPAYGKNDFHADGEGTVTDRATGLMWAQADSGKGMNWETALAWVQTQNAAKHLGHDDWRLPSVKELQSLVDYTRSPETTHSAAIDPLFNCTTITNAAKQADFPFYWSGTTHGSQKGGDAAMYVAFGRAAGWMSSRGMGGPPPRQGDDSNVGPGPGGGSNRGPGPGGGPPSNGQPPQRAAQSQGTNADIYQYINVHGAGSQRSDPKSGDPAKFPHGRGPQGDVISIFNYVRLVRGGGVVRRNETIPWVPASAPAGEPEFGGPPGGPDMGRPRLPASPIITELDLNGDGTIDADELAKAPESLKKLDKNGDEKLSLDEIRPARPDGRGGSRARRFGRRVMLSSIL